MWLLVAIVGRFILGSSAVADKAILKKSYPNPIGYVFWLGILGLAALVLLPSGFQSLPWSQIAVALAAGVCFMLAMLFLYTALFRTEASRALILIGAISPIFTLIFTYPFAIGGIQSYEITALAMLCAGGAILFFTEERHLRLNVFLVALASAFFLGLSDALTKLTFLGANFVTGFIWIKIGGAIAALMLLGIPYARRKIFKPPKEHAPKKPFQYVLNRAYAGLGSLCIAYAILLGPAALVDATLNFQYGFIMIGGWFVLKETFHGRALVAKLSSLAVISLGLTWLAVGNYIYASTPAPDRPIAWGVSFSQKFSEELGLDWKQNYEAIVNDLHPKQMRLMAYWDLVEKNKDKFDFADLDYQMSIAEKNHVAVILAIGEKVPRWPECHDPTWAKILGTDDRRAALLDEIKALVTRYKTSPALRYWQVENEPFLAFGECPPVDETFFDNELALVKSLDPAHLTLTTDSGELSLWYQAASRGDVFGTTVYRRVYNRIFGQIQYYLQPEFFRVKEAFTRFVTRDFEKKYIVVELGAEPWLEHQIYETPLADQLKVFDLPYFKDTITYAKETGFDEFYLWGSEWWYWMKVRQNTPEFWNYAKSVINPAP